MIEVMDTHGNKHTFDGELDMAIDGLSLSIHTKERLIATFSNYVYAKDCSKEHVSSCKPMCQKVIGSGNDYNVEVKL